MSCKMSEKKKAYDTLMKCLSEMKAVVESAEDGNINIHTLFGKTWDVAYQSWHRLEEFRKPE